jgi:amino acid adenylation domain-containing protein
VGSTEERIARLSPERRALLYALAQGTRPPAAQGVPRAARDTHIPASFAQQRLWFIDRLEPGNVAYNCPIAVRLSGTLDVAALEDALNDVVRRQEALRTTFDTVDGEVVQVVRPALTLELPVTDLADLDPAEREERVAGAIADDLHTAFDLVRGPLIRVRLLRLAAAEHVFLYDVHHIANDGWSVGIFLSELAEAYSARVDGRDPALPELPVQYADYAVWQRGRITDDLISEQSGYWRERLDGLTRLDMPTDLPRPAVLSPYGGIDHLDLPRDAVAGLMALGREEGASAFMSLMAVCAVLLMRYSGQDDIPIGTAATDRDRAELRHLIGFFPNTVIVRSDLSGGPGFRDVLRRVRDAARGAYAHADLPFDLLVRELAPQREPGRTPLFDLFFTVDDTPARVPGLTGLTADMVIPDVLTAKFDLGFTVRLDDDVPSIHCAYSTDLYLPETIAGLLESFRVLLASVVADPERAVTDVDMLGPERRRRVLVDWNDTAAPYPDRSRLHEPFEAAAARQPALPAVVCGGRRVDYRTLDAWADRIARRLRAGGTGPDSVVGVCVSRSPELVAALLGVLKAGAAYLPLDPDYPAARLALMLSDSLARGVITDDTFRGRFAGLPVPVLPLSDLLGGRPADPPADGPVECPASPDDLAYVIYTSGSTGTPKGIGLRHRGAVNNFHDFNTRFGIGPGDTLLSVSSPSFDMAVFDTVGYLGAGGALVLPEPFATRDPARWADLLVEHQVTVWHSAPALLDLVLERLEETEQSLPALRLALLGGDWIPLGMPGRLRALAPGVRFIALGGATEASMDSTLFEVREPDPRWTSVPYGRPMANQRAYILDAHLQPVPAGVPGELYLAGVGLARGYLGRPDLSADRFITHTFEDGLSDRIYRTGDRARYGHDGVIELLGRVDFQVKIRGLRIEPGEVEAVLREHEDLAEVVVVARGARGQSTLAAFYVATGDGRPDEAALRSWAGERLPHHMVPSVFVALPALPTTPNGKVDRRSLSEHRVAPVEVSPGPRSALEEKITQVWKRTLDVGDFGVDENFFDLGGDSFAAIRSVVAIDRRVPVIDLFKNPTVRSLAAHIEATLGGADQGGTATPAGTTSLLQRLVPLRRAQGADRSGVRRQPRTLICVPYGGGNPIAYQPLADALPPDWALWTVALPGHDHSNLDTPFLSIDEAAARCADEAAAHVSGPVTVYGQCAGVALAVRIAQVLEERGADVSAVYVGAALPDPDPEGSQGMGETLTDEQIHGYLSMLGGFDGALEWTDVAAILRAVRHDASGASRFFLEAHRTPPDHLRAPLYCLIGDRDPATEGYETRYRDWETFGHVAGVHVIENGGHYFVRDHVSEVATLLFEHADEA